MAHFVNHCHAKIVVAEQPACGSFSAVILSMPTLSAGLHSQTCLPQQCVFAYALRANVAAQSCITWEGPGVDDGAISGQAASIRLRHLRHPARRQMSSGQALLCRAVVIQRCYAAPWASVWNNACAVWILMLG